MTLKPELQIVPVHGHRIRNWFESDWEIFVTRETEPTAYQPTPQIPQGVALVDVRHLDELSNLLWINRQTSGLRGAAFYAARESVRDEIALRGQRIDIPEYRVKVIPKPNYTLVYVDGGIVRQYIDPWFEQGGHHGGDGERTPVLYPYVPDDEIWVDWKIHPIDRYCGEFHEVIERRRMRVFGEIYDDAHDLAKAREKRKRRHEYNAKYPGDANYPANWTWNYLLPNIFCISS